MHIVSALISPPSLNIFFFDSMLHFSSLSSWFLVSTIIRVQPWKSLCKKEVWARGLKDWWPCPFPHLLLISVLMWSKLYCFAHRQATPPSPGHPSLSLSVRHTSLPWGALLKADHWSSAKGLRGSDHSALLTFVCLIPNYDVLRHKGLLMALHVLNICAASWSKGHLQQDSKYAHRK